MSEPEQVTLDLYATLASAASGDLYLADCPALFDELQARGCRMYAQHDSRLTLVHESVFLDVGAVRVHVQRTRKLRPEERRARLEAIAAEALEPAEEDPWEETRVDDARIERQAG